MTHEPQGGQNRQSADTYNGDLDGDDAGPTHEERLHREQRLDIEALGEVLLGSKARILLSQRDLPPVQGKPRES